MLGLVGMAMIPVIVEMYDIKYKGDSFEVSKKIYFMFDVSCFAGYALA